MDARLLNKRLHRWLGVAVLPIGAVLLVTGVILNHEKEWLGESRPRVLCLATLDEEGRRLLRGTLRGLERSEDGGRHWAPLQTLWPTEEAVGIAVNPRKPGTIYAALRWLGLIRSTDGGAVWEALSLPFQPEASGIELRGVSVSPGGRIFLQTSAGLLSRGAEEGAPWESVTFKGGRQDAGLTLRSLHNALFFGRWAVPLYDATALAMSLVMVSGVFLWRKTNVR